MSSKLNSLHNRNFSFTSTDSSSSGSSAGINSPSSGPITPLFSPVSTNHQLEIDFLKRKLEQQEATIANLKRTNEVVQAVLNNSDLFDPIKLGYMYQAAAEKYEKEHIYSAAYKNWKELLKLHLGMIWKSS